MSYAYPGSHGFTVLELVIVIAVIGILASLTIGLPLGMRTDANDQERADDTASIARRLEQAYTGQEIGGPAYPSTTEYATDIAAGVRTASRLDMDSLRAPGKLDGSSVVMATNTSTSNPINVAFTKDMYVYQPLTTAGGLCNATNSTSSPATTCVRFNLYYRIEKDDTIKRVKSFHQQ